MSALRVWLICGLAGLAATVDGAAVQGPSPTILDAVLSRYVHDGRVDYAALKANREMLERYLDGVARVTEAEFDGWVEESQIAYLINAYNAYMLQTVIDHYPIEGSGFFEKLVKPKRFAFPDNSVRHIDGVFDGIEHGVAGRSMTLDDIEHGMLRARYNEPRIHFALVCAAVSCPPLRREAYRGDRLDEQLDDQGRQFLNDPRLNRFEVERREIHLSKVFDWFAEDFTQFAPTDGYTGNEELDGVLAFVSRYVPDRVARFIATGDYSVKFEEYDWTLNDQAVVASRR